MTSPSPRPFSSIATRIIVTALLAGTLDAVGAMLVYQVQPAPLFKFIASGAFGKEAFSAGSAMIAWGILFHLFIALAWTIFYFLISPLLKFNKVHPLIMIPLYGVFIWVMMNFLILRFLSKIDPRPFDLNGAMVATAILIVAVSAPIVISAKRFYRNS